MIPEPPRATPDVPPIHMEQAAVGSTQEPDAVVVEDINWAVQAGDYWVVAGWQGAGKSELLRMTGGLAPPVRGCYRLFGEEMPIFEEPRLKTRLRLGLVFETGQLFNHLTVRENVALPLRYHRNLTLLEAADEVNALLDGMELGPWAETTPGALSVPWRRRVGLARALALRPEVLLVDSPLGGLDLRHRRWWLEFLQDLSKGHSLLQGHRLTLVVTSADMRPWRESARQFAVLKNRRLNVLGSWAQAEEAGAEILSGIMEE